jgi:hypothetical protein
MRINGKKW